jgi:hypothetical protein
VHCCVCLLSVPRSGPLDHSCCRESVKQSKKSTTSQVDGHYSEAALQDHVRVDVARFIVDLNAIPMADRFIVRVAAQSVTAANAHSLLMTSRVKSHKAVQYAISQQTIS